MEIQVTNGKIIIPDSYKVSVPTTTADGVSRTIEIPCNANARIEFIPITGKSLTKLTSDGVEIPFTASGGSYQIPISALNNSKVIFQFCDGTIYTVIIKIYNGASNDFTVTINKTGDGYVETVYNNGLFAGLMFVPDDAIIQSITINGITQTITNEHGMEITYTLSEDITVNVNFV